MPSDSILWSGATTLRSTLALASPPLAGSDPARFVQDVSPKDAGSIAALVKLLADVDATMRARAACTLARLGASAKDAIPALLEHLKDADQTVRFHAAYA